MRPAEYSDNAPIFRWQHVMALNWSAGPWSAVLANRYKDGYTDQGGASEVKALFGVRRERHLDRDTVV